MQVGLIRDRLVDSLGGEHCFVRVKNEAWIGLTDPRRVPPVKGGDVVGKTSTVAVPVELDTRSDRQPMALDEVIEPWAAGRWGLGLDLSRELARTELLKELHSPEVPLNLEGVGQVEDLEGPKAVIVVSLG